MSYLTEVNCTTILEAIRNEKKNQNDNENKDDFVFLHKVNTFWTDLFAKAFLCEIRETNVNDDMLYFVMKIVDSSSKDKIQVYRRNSKRLPCLTDLNYDWEETIYLNLILHEFEYTLTCAICTQTLNQDIQILKKHSKRVYASPSRRDLKSKGTEETITYPNIYFMIDDFEDAFNQMIVKENEMVCVELLANDGNTKRVLFLGSIRYESLKSVYDNRASTSAKLVEKVTFNTVNQKRVEFVKMKGPSGKGYAEMAVSRCDTDENESFLNDNEQTDNQLSPKSKQLNSFGSWKFTGFRFNNQKSTITSQEIEKKDSQQSSRNSIWDKTFGAALTLVKTSGQQLSNLSSTFDLNTSPNALNAYLTYLNLPLQTLMKDILNNNQQSVLTQ